MHFFRSKCMSVSPLCGRFANFYMPVRPVRQTLATAAPKPQKPFIFSFKMHVGVATLRPFPQFLYPGPPSASKIGHCGPKSTKTMRFLRWKWMSMSPLCGRFTNFYIPVRPVRQKLATSTPKPQKPVFFAVKVDVDVATLRPFRQFLYPGPPSASKIGHCSSKTTKTMHFLRWEWILCLLRLPGLLWPPLPPLGLAGGPAGGLSPLPRLEITLIRPCRTMRKYAVKRDVDVATLRPFGPFP